MWVCVCTCVCLRNYLCFNSSVYLSSCQSIFLLLSLSVVTYLFSFTSLDIYVRTFVCLFIFVSIHLSISLYFNRTVFQFNEVFAYLSVCPSIYQSIYPSVYLFRCLPSCIHVCLSVCCLSAFLSVCCLSAFLSVCLLSICLFVCVYLSVCLPTYLATCPLYANINIFIQNILAIYDTWQTMTDTPWRFAINFTNEVTQTGKPSWTVYE